MRPSQCDDDDWLGPAQDQSEQGSAETVETITRVVWLFLLADGGWWTVGAITSRFPYFNPRVAGNAIWAMANRRKGLPAAFTREGEGGAEYAVTPECIPPRQVPAWMIVRAVQRLHNKKGTL